MCNCIERVSDGVKKAYAAESITVPLEVLSGRTYTCCEVYMNDKAKPIMSNLMHSYCPFCGEKYDITTGMTDND